MDTQVATPGEKSVDITQEELTISVVVPAFNEHAVLREFYRRTVAALTTVGAPFEIVFVNDGSRDATLDIMAGDNPGLGCAHRCLTFKDPDAGTVLFGTTACGPVPSGLDTTESDPRCIEVRDALANTRLCSADAGRKDSGSDASSDASGDASDASAD